MKSYPNIPKEAIMGQSPDSWTHIHPGCAEQLVNGRELLGYADLFWAFSRRTLTIKYKQMAAGVLWAILRPLFTVLILTVVFEFILGIRSDRPPTYLLIYAAVLPWTLFANTLSQNSMSLITNASILSKIYFPRILLPASVYLAGVTDFIIAFGLFLGFLIYNGYYPGLQIILLPLFLFLTITLSFSFGLIFAVLNVRYRDVQYIVPFLLQIGLYLSPIAYSSHRVPALWKWIYELNPMVAIIDGFRWVLFPDQVAPTWPGLLSPLVFSLVVGYAGLIFFRKMERTFADEI